MLDETTGLVFNKDIEILYLAEICKYMNTPHFRTELGPTLDRELLTKNNVRILNDKWYTATWFQSWASLTSTTHRCIMRGTA